MSAAFDSILIVEDEPVIARRIERLCRELNPGRNLSITHVDTVDDGIARLEAGGIDLLLLDLNLHGEDGFTVLEAVTAFAAQTVIISAYADQAIRAFEYGVLDFIAKPFEADRLARAFDRANGSVSKPETTARFLNFRSGRRTRVVGLEMVVLLRGADKYSEVVLETGEVLLHDRSLGKIEQVLPDRFLRVHKSRIVALDRIRSVESAAGNVNSVVLDNGERAPVSRSRIAQVRAFFQQSREG